MIKNKTKQKRVPWLNVTYGSKNLFRPLILQGESVLVGNSYQQGHTKRHVEQETEKSYLEPQIPSRENVLEIIKSYKLSKSVSRYMFSPSKIVYLCYYFFLTLYLIYNTYTSSFLPPNHPIYPSTLFSKSVASFLLNCYCMHMCIWIYIWSPKYNLLSPYTVNCIYVFSSIF